MKFEIIENNAEQVKVRVTVSKRKWASDPNVRVDSTDVMDYLAKEKISVDGIVKETKVDNYSVTPRLVGEWIFKKPVLKSKKKRKVNVPTTTTTAEAVSPPTTTRRRRKKQTTTTTKEDKLLRTEDLE